MGPPRTRVLRRVSWNARDSCQRAFFFAATVGAAAPPLPEPLVCMVSRVCVYIALFGMGLAEFAQQPPALTRACFHNPQVDLICCLASKHEEPGGGAGSLSNVYVADGTGFAVARTPSAVLGQRDAALLKGVRAALGNADWSPVNPSPSPFPAYLKIEVVENKKEVGLRCACGGGGDGDGGAVATVAR